MDSSESGSHPPASSSQREGARSDDSERLHPKFVEGSAEYVPPHLWGLSLDDIKDFEGRVKETFKGWQQPQEPAEFYNKEYDDPQVGPSVYTVTTDLIKVEARRNHGLSWALMRNEKGLACHGFSSHAWIEGIYEFLGKLQACWPRDVGGMYICFLSNPQIGVSSLLQDAIERSPFHRALDHATHVLIVPNRIGSIYNRLWCAYEMYHAMHLAETKTLSIELAFGTPKMLLMVESLAGMLVAACAFSLSYFVLAQKYAELLGPVMWLATSFLACLLLSMVCRHLLKHAMHRLLVSGNDSEAVEKWHFRCQLLLVYFELILWALGSGCAMRHLWKAISQRWGLDVNVMEDDAQFETLDRHVHVKTFVKKRDSFFYRAYMENGEEVPCTLLAFGMVCVFFQHIFLVLQRQVILKESHMLDFKGIRNAHAHSLDDEHMLLGKIDPEIQKVETLINMLRTIGRYNRDIRENLKLGLGWKQARDGTKRRKALTAVVAWQFWWMADLAGHHHIGWVILLGTVMCILVVCLMHKFGDRATFAVEAFFWFGFAFVQMSNWACFWKEDYVQGRRMSASTLWLQVVMLSVTLLLCYLFYSGQLAECLGKMDKWKGDLKGRPTYAPLPPNDNARMTLDPL